MECRAVEARRSWSVIVIRIVTRIAVCLLACHAALARAGDEPVNTPLPERVRTQQAGFEVRIADAPKGLPQNQMQRWVLSVKDAAGKPVIGASIRVEGNMPEHGHGFATAPSVTALGAGNYAVEGLKFHMPGYWEIAFNIQAGKLRDRAQFRAYLE
jgi:hypothetical protein